MEQPCKALFLDRDGVVNIDKHYLYKIEEFEFVDGIFELCHKYQNAGYLIFIITNQSGIGKKMYTQNDFDIITNWMVTEFKKEAITISEVFYCPHDPEESGPCDCRKPSPKMILDAATQYKIDLSDSVLIGDKISDIEAGKNSGIGTSILIKTNILTKALL